METSNTELLYPRTLTWAYCPPLPCPFTHWACLLPSLRSSSSSLVLSWPASVRPPAPPCFLKLSTQSAGSPQMPCLLCPIVRHGRRKSGDRHEYWECILVPSSFGKDFSAAHPLHPSLPMSWRRSPNSLQSPQPQPQMWVVSPPTLWRWSSPLVLRLDGDQITQTACWNTSC